MLGNVSDARPAFNQHCTNICLVSGSRILGVAHHPLCLADKRSSFVSPVQVPNWPTIKTTFSTRRASMSQGITRGMEKSRNILYVCPMEGAPNISRRFHTFSFYLTVCQILTQIIVRGPRLDIHCCWSLSDMFIFNWSEWIVYYWQQ